MVIWDINEKNAETTAKEIFEETGVKAKAVQCDVSDRAEVAKAAKITRFHHQIFCKLIHALKSFPM